MLGQLFGSLTPGRRSAPRPPPLDSVTEDAHTLSLLFPDNAVGPEQDTLSPTIPSSDITYSLRTALGNDSAKADIDLEYPRDIRILIAQGESGPLQEVLLFDSRPSSVVAKESPKARYLRPARTDLASQNSGSLSSRQHVRPTVISTIPEDAGRTSPGFGNALAGGMTRSARLRRTSVSSTHSLPEETSQTRQRDTDDVVKTAMSCMFENATSSYKGTSNKIHIVPLEPKPYDGAISTSLTNEFNYMSLGRSHVRRPSTLSRSHTPGDTPISPSRPASKPDDYTFEQPRRRTVLITRTFSISWAEEEVQVDDPFLSGQNGHTDDVVNVSPINIKAHNGALFEPASPSRTIRTKHYRSPMYAITVVIQLPIATGDMSTESLRYGSIPSRSLRRSPHTSLPSSFESERRSALPVLDSIFGERSMSLSFSSDVDDRVDMVGHHWDIISRALTTMQYLAQQKILEQLKPLPSQKRAARLLTQALALDEDIRAAAEYACLRIVRGIKIPRVRTGQGRWGIWREEARWLGQWAGTREENFFFFNLLTAFLGTHTEWLSTLAPKSYCRLNREFQRLNQPEDLSVPSRTIIVSKDKMAARRLIFLLSTFLPSNYHARGGDTSPLRPSTAASFRTYSQSPPVHLNLSRQESLRRTVTGGKIQRSRARHRNSRGSASSIFLDLADEQTETGTITSLEVGTHTRRPSDTRSIIKSKMAATESDLTTRKSSATTTPTITPSSAVPVPHFTYHRKNSSGYGHSRRPSSRESMASINLMNALHRNDSSNTTDSTSKWGSFKSFWSMGTRRESSTDFGDNVQSTDEGLGIKGVAPSGSTHGKSQRLSTEIQEDEMRNRKSQDLQVAFVDDDPNLVNIGATAEEPSPLPIDIPLKMSVNEADGVIDVEVPFQTFDSPLPSPAIPGYHSGSSYGDSSLGNSSFMSMNAREPDHPLNVGGWLEKLHPDFTVQAIKPYADLLDDVKAAMSAEPNPPSLASQAELGQSEKWFDICTSIIADASTFTIQRLRLRRLIRFNRAPNLTTAVSPGLHGPLRSQYGNPYTQGNAPPSDELTIEEKFEEETIMDFDGTLADVIERVLAQSATSSTAESIASSRSSSHRGRREVDADGQRENHRHHEIPRTQCKRAIIDVLEQIAFEVAKSRKKGRVECEYRRSMDDINSTLRAGINAWYDRLERHRDAEIALDGPENISNRGKFRSESTTATIPVMIG